MDTNQSSDSSQPGIQSGSWENKMLGRYRLLRLLGRGGMGEVWLAEDTQLRRQVAVKLLPTVFATNRDFLQDFEREARAAARLEHPHILPVHDFGEQVAGDEVVTYLITPYISGGSLRDRILAVGGPLPVDEAMGYLRQAAEAIDFAHSQHVLHRDIKPANMLLQEKWLFLADFGIAKLLTSTTHRTRTHAGSGTPDYMAPEQALGRAQAASDRYSFAMTAYHLFTGRVPFSGDTPYSILLKHLNEQPTSPRQFNPALPEAVEQAILQGLAKSPQDRPASCMALVNALERGWNRGMPAQVDAEASSSYQGGEGQAKPSPYPTPISTDPYGTFQTPVTDAQLQVTEPPANRFAVTETPAQHTGEGARGSKRAPQAPLSAPTSIASSFQPTIAASGVAGTEAPQRKVSRRAILIGGATALVATGGAVSLFTFLHSNTPATPVRPGSHSTHPTPIPGPKKLVAGVPVLSLTGHSKDVSIARWDPTGRYLATAAEDAYVMLWDLASSLQNGSTNLQTIATPMRKWKLSSPILTNGLCWSADGHTIAVVTGESKIYLYDAFANADTPQVYAIASAANGSNAPVHTAIAWSPKGNTFATPSYISQQPLQAQPIQQPQQVDLWQMGQTNNPIRILNSDATGTARTLLIDVGHPYNSPANVDMIGWSSDGSLVAGHTNFGSVTIWQAATGAVSQVFSLPSRPEKENPTYILGDSVAWSPADTHQLAISDLDIAMLWDVQQNKLLQTFKTTDPVPFLTGLAWSSNGKYLAGSYAESPRVYVWDAQMAGTGGGVQPQKLFFPQPGTHVHTATVTDVAWSPDGRYITSASGDTTVVVWLVDGG